MSFLAPQVLWSEVADLKASVEREIGELEAAAAERLGPVAQAVSGLVLADAGAAGNDDDGAGSFDFSHVVRNPQGAAAPVPAPAVAGGGARALENLRKAAPTPSKAAGGGDAAGGDSGGREATEPPPSSQPLDARALFGPKAGRGGASSGAGGGGRGGSPAASSSPSPAVVPADQEEAC